MALGNPLLKQWLTDAGGRMVATARQAMALEGNSTLE